MVSTFTRTATRTYTRIGLLKMQIRIALRRTTGECDNTLNRVIDKGLDHQWIGRVLIYAVDKSCMCRAQLTLDIDWDEHKLQLSRGHVSVSIDERWKDDTAIELDEIIALFNRYVEEYGLDTKWACYKATSAKISMEEYLKELGLVYGKPIQWERGWSSPIPELPELRVGCHLAES